MDVRIELVKDGLEGNDRVVVRRTLKEVYAVDIVKKVIDEMFHMMRSGESGVDKTEVKKR